ncbi:hypothetical protein ACFQ0B_08770 [Nonomuraea thailandensis]
MGVRTGELLVAAVTAERGGDSPEDRLVAVVRGYVRFAAGHRALFEALLATLTPAGEPELDRAMRPVKGPSTTPRRPCRAATRRRRRRWGWPSSRSRRGTRGCCTWGRSAGARRPWRRRSGGRRRPPGR